jgi:hypothetical protein
LHFTRSNPQIRASGGVTGFKVESRREFAVEQQEKHRERLAHAPWNERQLCVRVSGGL